MKKIELLSILPENISLDGFCASDYWVWESRVARPELEKLGYTQITFYNGDYYSCGPLSRIVRAYKNGEKFTFWYG